MSATITSMGSKKWEYKFTVFTVVGLASGGTDEAENSLNSEGNDGWEAVSLINGMGADGSWCLALLKRPKLESGAQI